MNGFWPLRCLSSGTAYVSFLCRLTVSLGGLELPVVPSCASQATYLKSHPNTLQRPRKSQRDSFVARGSGKARFDSESFRRKFQIFGDGGYGSFRDFQSACVETSETKTICLYQPKKFDDCLIKIVGGKLQVPQVPPWI